MAMGRAGRELLGVWAATSQEWMQCAIVIVGCYASVMDPRPDLAIPARSIKVPYFWWW